MSSKKKVGQDAPKKSNPIVGIFVIVIGVILIVAILSFSGIISFGSSNSSSPSFSAPQYDPWGSFAKVSTNDYAPSNSVNIYFISWTGCPIGAADSWVIYGALSQYADINSYIYTHHSSPNEGSYACIPGLIFDQSFSVKSGNNQINMDPVYLYNWTLFGEEGNNYKNPNGTGVQIEPPNSVRDQTLVTYGLSVAQQKLPPAIYNILKQYETVYPVTGAGGAPGAVSAELTSVYHLTTIMIITGTNGTYIFNGPFFNPPSLDQYAPVYIADNFPHISEIKNAVETLLPYLS
ncbi:DUF929 family protein [Cuniculiplasma sp. SKW3]|uniref:DUF929 family protein n=1 Tax=Cuniculiplasma sp. SKW3 TaxID=3400170 RepID=UPI003FD51F4E